MSGEQRREKMLEILANARQPVSGTALAKTFAVSRQVIVQDIALLRAQKREIVSTCRGYMMGSGISCQRIFKVKHSDDEMEEELNLYVDFGGMVVDEFVYHKIYNVIRVEMGLKSRRDVKEYIEKLESGISKSLKDVTSGFHYHTVTAESDEILDQIQEELQKRGFLAELRDYEPIDFWKE
ncbi:MAG: transcription repressor NadR [Eubacterium sp.]|jgi:transcriptional regulator of NAD metabolism|nr:transcription repressor NadR [Eubacterium sp.]